MTDHIREAMESFVKDNAFCAYMEMDILTLEDGYAKTKMPYVERIRNPYNSIHGGALYALADVTGGIAACSHGKYPSTIEGSMHFIKPAMNTEYIICEAKEIRHGKTIAYYETRIFNDKEELLDTATFSYYILSLDV